MAKQITKTFVFERETKGAIRYAEVDAAGEIIGDYTQFVIGTLYVRKSALNGDGIPSSLKVKIEFGE
jgi:hypothetical protein